MMETELSQHIYTSFRVPLALLLARAVFEEITKLSLFRTALHANAAWPAAAAGPQDNDKGAGEARGVRTR